MPTKRHRELNIGASAARLSCARRVTCLANLRSAGTESRKHEAATALIEDAATAYWEEEFVRNPKISHVESGVRVGKLEGLNMGDLFTTCNLRKSLGLPPFSRALDSKTIMLCAWFTGHAWE